MRDPYSFLADHYDRLMSDVDYTSIFDFVIAAFKQITGTRPGSILELACGTGTLAVYAAKQGYKVTGVDVSEQMLQIAKNKSIDKGLDITFINRDMSRFESNVMFDLAICCFDGMNHITDPEKLNDVFINVSKCISPGGLFIFDLNSAYKFNRIYSDNVYYESYDDLTYIWQNNYNNETGMASFELTFFQKDTDGKYIRYDETIYEKYYSTKAIDKASKASGLKKTAVYNGYSFNEPDRRSQRLLYIFKKPEDLFKY